MELFRRTKLLWGLLQSVLQPTTRFGAYNAIVDNIDELRFATSQQSQLLRPVQAIRMLSTSTKIHPSKKVAAQEVDVWTITNTAALETSPPPIHLGQGFMNFKPPQFLTQAAKDALDDVAANQYSHTKGRPRLRKALSKAYSPYFGRTLDWENEIVVTAGANEGMFSAFAAFLDEGDEVIVMEPYFDQYISNIEMNGGKIVYIPIRPPAAKETHSASEWTLDIEELRSKCTDRTKMIVLNTPHNPLGKMFSKEELLAIGQVAVEKDLIIVSDEVYDRLDYIPHHRIGTLSPELSSRTITVGSAGKTFGCTGWRIGWLIGEPHLIKYAAAANTRVVFSCVSPLQEAVAVAFEVAEDHGYYEKTVKAYQERMKTLNKVWDELGLPYTVPQGGYFVMVNTAKVHMPEDYQVPEHITKGRAKDFAMSYWFTKEIGVVAIPPTEFYTKEHSHLAQDWLRFAVCKDLDTLEEAVTRLRKLKQYIRN